MSDRPATEPRTAPWTESGRALEREIGGDYGEEIAAIEAEAAQGAAPRAEGPTLKEAEAYYEGRMDEWRRIRGNEDEGAAPRAEGLDVEAVLLRILTVCGGEGDDPTDVALAFQMIRDTVDDALARLSEGAAPRAEELESALDSLQSDPLFHWEARRWARPDSAKAARLTAKGFADAILARLSRPSDERVPESDTSLRRLAEQQIGAPFARDVLRLLDRIEGRPGRVQSPEAAS